MCYNIFVVKCFFTFLRKTKKGSEFMDLKLIENEMIPIYENNKKEKAPFS